MSSLDHRQNRSATKRRESTTPLPIPEQPFQPSAVEQLSFPENVPQTGFASQVPQYQFPAMSATSQPFVSPVTTESQEASHSQAITTEPLTSVAPTPNVTRQLSTVTLQLPSQQTGMLPENSRNTTTSLRQPVIIRGTGKKVTPPLTRPPTSRRVVVHSAVTAILVFIVLGTLIAVIPTGGENHTGIGNNPFQPIMNIVNSRSNNTGVIAQQAATATAVTQDGYDAGARVYAGVQGGPAAGSTGSLDRFFYGQCTYWANMRYHALTGNWVTWLGNANQWAEGAGNSGWIVSDTPKVPSIIVLQAGVQGSGYYGHVAVVERINSDGSVLSSNYNWAGNWARETWVTFMPGPGVKFVWHP